MGRDTLKKTWWVENNILYIPVKLTLDKDEELVYNTQVKKKKGC